MITKFLKGVDNNNRQIISAIVENSSATEQLNCYPLLEQASYQNNSEDIITSNSGELVYVSFNVEGRYKFLDISLHKDGVQIKLTDSISYATCVSKNVAGAILYHYNYFGFEDCQIVSSGFYRNLQGVMKDKYDNYFRKATDDCYCQIIKDDVVYFLARDVDKNYYLSEDFSVATRIKKADLRKIFTIYGIIGKGVKKSDLSFSKFNCFTNGNDYLFAGKNPLRISFNNNELMLYREDTKVNVNDRLINNEAVFNKIKGIFHDMALPLSGKTHFLKYNNKYFMKGENTFTLVDNPAKASLLDNLEIEVVKKGLSIFNQSENFIKYSPNSLYLYYIGERTFRFTTEPITSSPNGYFVEQSVYDEFNQAFSLFSSDNIEGVIVIRDNKYLQMEITADDSFKIVWLESAYHATVLSDEQVAVLVDIFKWDIQKRDIKNILINNGFGPYNIVYNDNADINQNYEKILKNIVKGKHRVCSFDLPSTIKIESEKGALEYLRRFYLKEVADSKKMFEIIFKTYGFINNVLIVGQGAYISLAGLSMTAKEMNKNVTVTTVDSSKWGYYPEVSLSDNVMYVAAYRFEFSNLVASLVELYDLIVFTKGFNEKGAQIAPLIRSVMNNGRSLVIANSKFCNIEKPYDPVYDYYKAKFPLKRKFFNHDKEEFAKGININKLELEKLRAHTCRCYKQACDVPDVVVGNDNSYHSIIYKEGFKVKDHYKT